MSLQRKNNTTLLVGLGNPGEKYILTRHNVGLDFVKGLSDRESDIEFLYKKNLSSHICQTQIEDTKIILSLPTTYMNCSGEAVVKIKNFYKLDCSDIIVLHDDLDLDVGRIKVKLGGGAGGHNGIQSITNSIGPDYMRIKIGIGRPIHKSMVSTYVLSKFLQDEYEKILFAQKKIKEHFNIILKRDITKIQTLFN
jgi:PTH1 family peptidyl-tRNA hydrolase